MTLTTALAEWIEAHSFDALSPEIIANAKLHILDGMGVGLDASALEPLFDPMIAIVTRRGGEGPSSVLGKPTG